VLSNTLQLAASGGARNGLEGAHVGVDLGEAHGIGRLAGDGAAERLEVVAHGGMGREKMCLRRLAAMRDDDVPSARVLGMGAMGFVFWRRGRKVSGS